MQKFRPFFSYYGGKQSLAPWIVSKIPKHLIYIEPFFGSGAVMFAKPLIRSPKYSEVINDLNSDVYNFYKQMRDNPRPLVAMLETAICSRELHRVSKTEKPKNDIERAFYFYMNIVQSFSGKLGASWCGVQRRSSSSHASIMQQQIRSTLFSLKRVQNCTIENIDVVDCIKKWDSPHSFFYLDPPYVGADQGHYSGYTQEDFDKLINTAGSLQGSFLMSCYDQSLSFEKFTKNVKEKASPRDKKGDRVEVLYRKFSQRPSREALQIYRTREFQKFVAHPWEKVWP